MLKEKIKKILKLGKVTYCPVTYLNKTELLKDKVVVVTGGGSGIGAAISETIVRHGGRVIIIGRNEDKLIGVEKKIGEDNCKHYAYDVSSNEGDVTFFENLEKLFNHKIDAIVNNAGIYISKSIYDLNVKDFNKTIDVNLKAPIFLTIGFIKYCEKYDIYGNDIIIASNRGMFGDIGPYGLSKKAIMNFVNGIGREYAGKKFRINAIAPGMTASDINGVDYNDNMYTSSARGERVLSPYEIAEIAVFLLGENSKCIQGSIIPCDEGDYLR